MSNTNHDNDANQVIRLVTGDLETAMKRFKTLVRNLVLTPALAGVVSILSLAPKAQAAGRAGAQPLPWEGPLNQILASFTGPVAKALCILAIVVLGFGFAFSEGGGLRRMLGLLLGVSIAVTATTFGVTFFGFDGGAGW